MDYSLKNQETNKFLSTLTFPEDTEVDKYVFDVLSAGFDCRKVTHDFSLLFIYLINPIILTRNS